MTIPEISVDTALAVTDKMVSDSPQGAAAWTFGQVQEFMKEQPALFHTITANIAQCFPRDEELDAELAAGKSLYLVLVTYKLIKSAIEAEELSQLFAEGDADGIQDVKGLPDGWTYQIDDHDISGFDIGVYRREQGYDE